MYSYANAIRWTARDRPDFTPEQIQHALANADGTNAVSLSYVRSIMRELQARPYTPQPP